MKGMVSSSLSLIVALLLTPTNYNSAGPYLRKTEFEGVVPASRLKLLQSTVAAIEERFSGDLQFSRAVPL
jgi:hypothetical protein